MSTQFVPLLAFLGPETWMILLVAGGVLLFGADKLPKLARSAGQAKKEFLVGQAEADLAAERAREEARKQAEINANAAATLTPSGSGVATPIPDPQTGTTTTTTAKPL
ncbi:MAG: twin-arginine translocase TatA/TatE family subunit [Candidatus Velthaea sp.]